MRYAVEIPGFEGHEIAVEVYTFSRPALIFDGAPVQSGAKYGDYFLNRNDGKLVPVQLKPAAMGSSMKLFRETSALFPNQIRAIESDEGGMRLVLFDKPSVPSSPPVVVKIYEGEQCRKIITFSGQQIKIGAENYEVLLDAKGNVMVVGRHGYWSSAEAHRSLGPCRIQAEPLEVSL